MLNLRVLLAGFLGGLVGIVSSIDVSEACLSSRSINISREIRKDYERLRKQTHNLENLKEKMRISYEEWKAAIENPRSDEAVGVRKKARFMGDYPEITMSLLDEEEKEKYEQFWKHFIIDVNKLKLNDSNPAVREAMLNYALPCVIEMQVDIDRTYSPVEIGTDARRFF